MSKIGKKSIVIPQGVDVKIDGDFILVKGPKGELKRNFPETLSVVAEGGNIKVSIKENTKEDVKELWGLYRSLIQNMVKGVTEEFEKVLEFQGVGYKAVVKGDDLEMGLGFSHPISIKAPEGITFKVEKNIIRISGIDKELVGKVADRIRKYRKPEPYKGSGIRYKDEVIKKKAGKKAVVTTGA